MSQPSAQNQATADPGRVSLGRALLGQTFVHPAFDYFFIGGALSLLVVCIVALNPALSPFSSAQDFKYFILFSNSAHFASSTVRLYTKPNSGGPQSFRFVKLALPLIALAVVTLCVFRADTVGAQMRSLYFTWSPYHYAAQTYGLTVMYCYRSGCLLSTRNKRLLWWVAMLPFIYNFTLFPTAGLHWLDFAGWLQEPAAIGALKNFALVMPTLAFSAVALLFWQVWRSEDRPMPTIGALMLVTNGVWWFILPPMKAFVWATIFHGIQYLAIVIIFHVRDQTSRPKNRRGTLFHVLSFYGASLALGFILFDWFPRAYMLAGFGAATSVMMTVGVINIHHFIVDAFIWRLKKSDPNRAVVDSAMAAAAT